jgi:ABC-type Zn uptake system ZnuABC Zn-binding protein ZnuA
LTAEHPRAAGGEPAGRIGRREVVFAAALVVSIAGLAILFAVLLGAFGGGDDAEDQPRIKVVTTLPVFADFVREVGGERVEVTSLVPLGEDPQTWQPAPEDARRVSEADIAFANGHDYEPAATELLRENLRPGAPLVEIAGDDERLEHEAGAEIFHESIAGGHQPVLWMSIQNGKAYTQFIRIELSKFDPDGEQEYKRNTEKYLERIDETEKYAFHRLDDIPPENKKLISTDTSLEYFSNYYAIELTGQLSLFQDQQITAEDVERIKNRIKERDALAVFVQPYSSPESEMLRRAGEEVGVAVCTLYSDSLDDKVSSYIELIRFDADELHRCLGGEV